MYSRAIFEPKVSRVQYILCANAANGMKRAKSCKRKPEALHPAFPGAKRLRRAASAAAKQAPKATNYKVALRFQLSFFIFRIGTL